MKIQLNKKNIIYIEMILILLIIGIILLSIFLQKYNVTFIEILIVILFFYLLYRIDKYENEKHLQDLENRLNKISDICNIYNENFKTLNEVEEKNNTNFNYFFKKINEIQIQLNKNKHKLK